MRQDLDLSTGNIDSEIVQSTNKTHLGEPSDKVENPNHRQPQEKTSLVRNISPPRGMTIGVRILNLEFLGSLSTANFEDFRLRIRCRGALSGCHWSPDTSIFGQTNSSTCSVTVLLSDDEWGLYARDGSQISALTKSKSVQLQPSANNGRLGLDVEPVDTNDGSQVY